MNKEELLLIKIFFYNWIEKIKIIYIFIIEILINKTK